MSKGAGYCPSCGAQRQTAFEFLNYFADDTGERLWKKTARCPNYRGSGYRCEPETLSYSIRESELPEGIANQLDNVTKKENKKKGMRKLLGTLFLAGIGAEILYYLPGLVAKLIALI